MKTDIYWIEGPWHGRLAILPRPRGGDWLADEVRSWKKAGINIVVSLLTPDETSDLELTQESKLVHVDGLEFLSFPIVDRSIPASRGAALEFVRKLGDALEQGKHVGIHCRQGIGRSAVIAASLLVLSGLDPEIAFQRVSDARGVSVPETPEQREWVITLSQVSMTEESTKLDEIEFEQPLEEEVESIPGERKIYTDKGDPEVDSLYGKYKKGKLILQPDFQRHFVWDSGKSSRLIESALLDIPLPVIYLSEEKDGKEYVIDGQQRLTAFFSFIAGKFPDGQDCKLTGLRVFQDLNKKTYKELDEPLQDKIKYCKIRTITFDKDSNKDLKFEIFERLNIGAVSLNDQELRNCIYRGSYNQLLSQLSQNKDFMFLMGLDAPEKRMKDVELVLRFAAFYHGTYLNYRPPMRRFLNDDMIKYQHIGEKDSGELTTAFKNSVMITRSLLDKHAFKRFNRGDEKRRNGSWEKTKFNASLYDILMYSFAKEDKNTVYRHLDSIREAFIHLMTDDQDFIRAIEISTSGIPAVRTRFDKFRLTLQEIVGIAQREPRCFSLKLKQELFDTNPTCALCGHQIQSIDDAAVDHIKQYWTGGQTIPENARLTHRYCNFARPRVDSNDSPAVPEKNSSWRNTQGKQHRPRSLKPVAFTFKGTRYNISSSKDILRQLCTILYQQNQQEFQKLLDMRGTKREYFSNDRTEMDDPFLIPRSNIYVETKWSAQAIEDFCLKILIYLGYEKSDIQIE